MIVNKERQRDKEAQIMSGEGDHQQITCKHILQNVNTKFLCWLWSTFGCYGNIVHWLLCPGLPLPPPSLHILNFMPDLTGLCKWLRLILGQGQIAQADVFVLGFHASLPSLWLDLASYNGFNQTNLKTDTCFVCNDEPDSHIIGCRMKIFRNSETV